MKGSQGVTFNTSKQRSRGSSFIMVDSCVAALLLLIGMFMLHLANKNIAPFVSGSFYLVLGLLATLIVRGDKYEIRTFLLTFSMCNLVAGVAQMYSMSEFKIPMSTTDALTFENLIGRQNLTSIEEIRNFVNAPLAVYIWKQLYSLFDGMGLKDGNWIAIQFNALLVGLSGVFTTKAAREMIGRDPKRLKRVGTLFAICGLNLLLGSILLRDAFALFFNIIVFWSLIKTLCRPSITNILFSLLFISISIWGMLYIRHNAVYIFGLIGVLAIGVWYLGSRFSPVKFFISIFIGVVGLFAFSLIQGQTTAALEELAYGQESYAAGSEAGARRESLGVSLVVNQPLPIRAVAGSLYMIIRPIPLWGYFQFGVGEYGWVTGIQGIFAVLIMPMVLLASLNIIKRLFRQSRSSAADLFLMAYFYGTIMLVAITTLEMRHYAQFIPGLILMASIQTVNTKGNKVALTNFRYLWYGGVIAIHMAWSVVRYL